MNRNTLPRFLGSLKIAVPLLIAIAGVLAWGTVYEARFGTAAVQRFIYQSWWFQALLGFLAVNLAVAALERYPWKRTQAPFVLAHVGIILILVGGILGGRFGVNGQLIIPEGEASKTLQLFENVLVVRQQNPGIPHVIPTNFETQAWVHEPNLTVPLELEGRRIQLTVDRYYPDAVMEEQVRDDGPGENPAVHVRLAHEGQEESAWLLARDPERFGVAWGEVHLLFLEPKTREQVDQVTGRAGTASHPRGALSLRLPGMDAPREIPVPAERHQELAVEGTPYRITFKDYFPDFAITEEGPVSRSQQPNNPAVSFTLSGPEGTDAYLLFALHPDFPALHGLTHTIDAQATYQHAASGSLPPNGIGLIRAPSGTLLAVLTGSGDTREVVDPLEVGKRYTHPSLGYEFEVTASLPKAVLEQQIHNLGDEVKAEALHLIGREGEHTAEAWVTLREQVSLPLGTTPILVEYRPGARDLPFTVKLLDFRKTDYPGTQMAAGFESDVQLTDPQRGLILMRKISMNNPLRYRGYSFYQSSYVQAPTETTILSVRNDPGTPFVYAGFLIVIAGVISMFILHAKTPAAGPASLGVVLLLGLAGGAGNLEAALSPEAVESVRPLAIQHNGRHKPFDSFARETLDHITGRPRVGREDPVETVLSILAQPERWQEQPLLAVPFGPLREALGMDRARTHVSYNELVSTRKLMRMLPAIAQKQQRDEKLTMLEQETWDAFERFTALSALFDQKFDLVPPPPSSNSPVWLPIFEPAGYPPEQQAGFRDGWTALTTAVREGRSEAVGSSARDLVARLRAANPAAYPAAWRLHLEVWYNRAGLFGWARLLYALAAVGLILGLATTNPLARWAGVGALWAGFLLHGAGIAIRVVLGGRPPVSNFFETMLWLPFVGVVVALVFERIYRVGYFGIAASILAAITLELSRHVPLDSSLVPVVAVLRSNLWLTIHVLTIVASYGALALATMLAHIYGGLYLVRRGRHPALGALDLFLYRAIQVGVVLLAGGIMLGAVWANASWGRYWGWDPKETWALITLLWFLASLHGRFAGWLKGVGVALCTIAGFFLLLMTYYGVSFYLVGLHSYAGGHAKPVPPLLIAYLVAELAFMMLVGLTALARQRRAS